MIIIIVFVCQAVCKILVDNEHEYTIPLSSSPIPEQIDAPDEKQGPVIWNRSTTLCLIDLYKQYRHKVGSREIKSLKQMWELFGSNMTAKYGFSYSAENCHNKWKVLLRNYKKAINGEDTRNAFQYEKEMAEIYVTDTEPEYILVTNKPDPIGNYSSGDDYYNINSLSDLSDLDDEPVASKKKATKNETFKVLEKIKYELKEYHGECLKMKRIKIKIEKRKVQVMEERNRILKMYLEKNLSLPI